MKKWKWIILALIGLLYTPLGGCNWFGHKSTYTATDISISELLDTHNKIRIRKNRRPLTINTKLNIAAQKHAEWMASTGHFSHTGQNFSRPSDRIVLENYKWNRVGENIAIGQISVNAVMKSWMGSSGHKNNILGNYTEVGFGVIKNHRGQIIWVAVFATPT